MRTGIHPQVRVLLLAGLLACLAPRAASADEPLPELVARVLPSVVTLHVVPTPSERAGTAFTPGSDAISRRFFAGAPRRDNAVTGSGFIASADGDILTADFLIVGGASIEVELADRRSFPAKLVAWDRSRGVALVKIEARGLAPLRFGEPRALRPGERLFAIGASLRVRNSVSDGIVSALDVMQSNEGPFLQTTVPINPGSAGGPLFDMRGELVGMAHSIWSRSRTFMGLSYAIPAAQLRRAYDDLRTHGRPVRGMIGIQVQEPSTPVGARAAPAGAIAQRVEADGAAAAAGMKDLDRVMRWGGIAVESAVHLTILVRDAAPGSKVPVQVLRGGRAVSLDLTIGQAP